MNDTTESAGIVRFLAEPPSRQDCEIALRVLRTFKQHESQEEWLSIMFASWAKLEQLEEFLDFLVGEGELKEDTQRELARWGLEAKRLES